MPASNRSFRSIPTEIIDYGSNLLEKRRGIFSHAIISARMGTLQYPQSYDLTSLLLPYKTGTYRMKCLTFSSFIKDTPQSSSHTTPKNTSPCRYPPP